MTDDTGATPADHGHGPVTGAEDDALLGGAERAAEEADAEDAVGDATGEFARPFPGERNELDDMDLDDIGLDEMGTVVEHDIEVILSERDQFKDIAQRLQADFDNYRKRAAAQVADEVDRATGRLAEALLPVLDAAEAAYLQHPDEVGPLLNVLLGELRKHGLETLDLDGQPFDPTVAEAVAHDEGDGGDVVVADVLRSGYRWRNRVLRPAMVRTRG
jgi:molecular chaperone GrpE